MKICVKCDHLKENNEFTNAINICDECMKGNKPKIKIEITKFYHSYNCKCGKVIFSTSLRAHLKTVSHKQIINKLNLCQ